MVITEIILAILLVSFFLFLSKKIKLLDKPHLYEDTRGTRKPVPTVQWVFLFLIFVILLFLFHKEVFFSSQILPFVIWWWILMLIWFLDDVAIGVRLPVWFRFLVQILVSVWVVYFANLERMSVSFLWNEINFGESLGLIISSLRFIICINAINWFDWINAQTSGISTIWFVTIIFLIHFVVLPNYPNITTYRLENLNTTMVLWTIFGVLAFVYTIVERKPWGLLRDAGSLLFWFALAYLSLSWGTKVGTVLVVLSLVLFDAVWVVFHRIFFLKKKPRKWDFTHLHHRLLRLWWNKKEINTFVRSWSVIMMILMLLQWQNKISKLIIFFLMLLIFFVVNSYLFWIKKLPCWFEKDKKY